MKSALSVSVSRLRTLLWGGAAFILITLWAVMRLTGQGDWTAFDYVAASLLLGEFALDSNSPCAYLQLGPTESPQS